MNKAARPPCAHRLLGYVGAVEVGDHPQAGLHAFESSRHASEDARAVVVHRRRQCLRGVPMTLPNLLSSGITDEGKEILQHDDLEQTLGAARSINLVRCAEILPH